VKAEPQRAASTVSVTRRPAGTGRIYISCCQESRQTWQLKRVRIFARAAIGACALSTVFASRPLDKLKGGRANIRCSFAW